MRELPGFHHDATPDELAESARIAAANRRYWQRTKHAGDKGSLPKPNIVALGRRGDSLPPASRSHEPSNSDTSDTSNDRSDR